VQEKERAEKGAQEKGASAEDEETVTCAQQENRDGPDEIELLFDGERPEVRKRKSRGPGVVAKALRNEVGVLEVEGEGEELVMEVEAEDEGGQGEGGEDAVVQGEDSKDAAGVELTKEAGIWERVVEDTGDEETGEDEEEIDAAGAKSEGFVDEGFERGVGGGGKEVRTSDAEDREATDAVECGKMARVGACLRYAMAVAAGLHSFSMVAARTRRMNSRSGGKTRCGQLISLDPWALEPF
jgi:hypothetical protein